MAELSTIARPYAEALFAAAQSDTAAGALDRWQALVEELGATARHPAVVQVIGDPNLSAEQIYALLTAPLNSALPDVAQNFLKLVIANDRVAALPEIAMQFRRLKNAAEGSADCVIESAFPLSEAQVKELVWGLSRKFGLQLKPDVKVDPELIGGVRVSVADHVLDFTVRTRLANMHAALIAA
jgi:F-type H+-transporting ATPase subunit delta